MSNQTTITIIVESVNIDGTTSTSYKRLSYTITDNLLSSTPNPTEYAYQLLNKNAIDCLNTALQAETHYLVNLKHLFIKVRECLTGDPTKLAQLQELILNLMSFYSLKLDIESKPDYNMKVLSIVAAGQTLLKNPQDDKAYAALLAAVETL